MIKRKLFDEKCLEVARHFLLGMPGTHGGDDAELAAFVQQICEDYCRDVEERDGVLRGCPFCGSPARFGYIDATDHPDCGGHYVECCNPACATSSKLQYGEEPRRLLQEAWNKRETA